MRLTDLLPLRTSADLGHYTDLFTLPRVLGTVTCAPVRYDGGGHLWLVSDGIIQGIDRVEINGRASNAWTLQQTTDNSGHPVAVLETQEQLEGPDTLRLTVRGEIHPDTGDALDRPDLQIAHLLRLAGLDPDPGRLDDLRAWSQTQGLTTGGILNDHTVTVQTALDQLCQASGLAWANGLTGTAQPWPPLDADPVATLTARESPTLSAQCRADDLVTVLEIAYDYDWSREDHRATVRLTAPQAVDRYGERLARIDRGWLHDARAAIAHGERWLAYHARPLWRLTATAPRNLAQLGDRLTVDHAYSAISAGIVTARAWQPTGARLTLEAPHGTAPTVQLDSTATGAAIDALAAPVYQYNAGTATWTITDTAGNPIPGARVTLDGAATRTADNTGVVQFDNVEPGPHVLLIRAQNHDDQTLNVTVS